MAKKKLSAAQLAALEALQKFEASTVAVADPPAAVTEEPVAVEGNNDGKAKGASKKAKKAAQQDAPNLAPVKDEVTEAVHHTEAKKDPVISHDQESHSKTNHEANLDVGSEPVLNGKHKPEPSKQEMKGKGASKAVQALEEDLDFLGLDDAGGNRKSKKKGKDKEAGKASAQAQQEPEPELKPDPVTTTAAGPEELSLEQKVRKERPPPRVRIDSSSQRIQEIGAF